MFGLFNGEYLTVVHVLASQCRAEMGASDGWWKEALKLGFSVRPVTVTYQTQKKGKRK